MTRYSFSFADFSPAANIFSFLWSFTNALLTRLISFRCSQSTSVSKWAPMIGGIFWRWSARYNRRKSWPELATWTSAIDSSWSSDRTNRKLIMDRSRLDSDWITQLVSTMEDFRLRNKITDSRFGFLIENESIGLFCRFHGFKYRFILFIIVDTMDSIV